MKCRVVSLYDRGDYIEAVFEDESPAMHWLDVKCGRDSEYAKVIIAAHTSGFPLELTIAQ